MVERAHHTLKQLLHKQKKGGDWEYATGMIEQSIVCFEFFAFDRGKEGTSSINTSQGIDGRRTETGKGVGSV